MRGFLAYLSTFLLHLLPPGYIPPASLISHNRTIHTIDFSAVTTEELQNFDINFVFKIDRTGTCFCAMCKMILSCLLWKSFTHYIMSYTRCKKCICFAYSSFLCLANVYVQNRCRAFLTISLTCTNFYLLSLYSHHARTGWLVRHQLHRLDRKRASFDRPRLPRYPLVPVPLVIQRSPRGEQRTVYLRHDEVPGQRAF